MAKPKFSLNANPTFKAVVDVPVPGGASAPVEFTFKSRTRDEFRLFIDGLGDRQDVDVIMDVASGWELEDPFDQTHVALLTQNYLGAARVVIEKYLSELTAARLGN